CLNYLTLLLINYKFIYSQCFVLDRKCFACAQMAGFQLMKLLTIHIFACTRAQMAGFFFTVHAFDIDHP
ncbi:hypothetical protein RYX36_028887, partial [Vicia faba]